MKKVAILTVVVALVALFGVIQNAKAGPQEKVAICHVNDANDVVGPFFYGIFGPWATGRVIEVNANALPDHFSHGDSAEYGSIEEFVELLNWIGKCFLHNPTLGDQLYDYFGQVNSDCAFDL